jgi:hypothetical protein
VVAAAKLTHARPNQDRKFRRSIVSAGEVAGVAGLSGICFSQVFQCIDRGLPHLQIFILPRHRF